jgi:hypothetical protein
MKKQEVVYTYGYYIRKYISEAKSKGAIAIVCSPIPRNIWKEDKVERSEGSYATWAQQIAKAEDAYFIDLNNIVAQKYEAIGADAVKPFFPVDHTHTNLEGAKLNTEIVMSELKRIKPGRLVKYVR